MPAAERGRIYAVMRAGDQAVTVSGEVGGGALATYGSIRGGIGWASGLTALMLLGVIAPNWQPRRKSVVQ